MLPFRFLLLFHVSSVLATGRRDWISDNSNRLPLCECGVQKGGPIDIRIVGGQPVPDLKYPWMAAILYNKFFNCGGSIINDRYILTAGHCVYGMKPEEILVILGTNKLAPGLGTRIMAEDLLLHENYIRENLHDINDIGLIRLKEKITYSENISPICLPTADSKNYAGALAYVAGWGRIGESLPISKDMLHVQLTVLSYEECKNASFGDLITEGMMCTYTENKDACQGDSGGPLIHTASDGKSELIGIISWGLGCAAPDMPGVYTNVQAYLPWILEKTKTANYCPRIRTNEEIISELANSETAAFLTSFLSSLAGPEPSSSETDVSCMLAKHKLFRLTIDTSTIRPPISPQQNQPTVSR